MLVKEHTHLAGAASWAHILNRGWWLVVYMSWWCICAAAAASLAPLAPSTGGKHPVAGQHCHGVSRVVAKPGRACTSHTVSAHQ